MERTQELTTKIYPLLPIVVGKAIMWGKKQKLVCRLSITRSCGWTIADELKFFEDVAMKYF